MSNVNFGRSYRLMIGPAGGTGFETSELHISFSLEKTDLETSNTARLEIWNLNDEHRAMLKMKDCAVALHAGYGSRMPLVFAGGVSFVSTAPDGTDKKTTVEVEDGLIATKDTYVSLSYEGKVNSKTILDDVAGQMGVAVTYSYNAEFADIPNGYSFVGMAKDVLSVICKTSDLSWSMDTQTYGGRTKGAVHTFLKDRWPEIQQRRHFEELWSLDQWNIERYEAMSDEEWYRLKYEKKISDFTDEEIAAEFNRRLQSRAFHNLGVEVRAVVTERR